MARLSAAQVAANRAASPDAQAIAASRSPATLPMAQANYTASGPASTMPASSDAEAIAASRSPATPALTAAATNPVVNMPPTTLSSLASGVGIGGGGPPISSQNPYSLAYLAANGIGNYLGTFYDPMDKTSGSAYFSAYQNPQTGAYYFAPGSASGSAAMIWPYGDPVMGFGPGSLSGQGQPAGYTNPGAGGIQYPGGAGGLGAGSIGGFSPAGGLAGLGAPSGGGYGPGTTSPGTPGTPGTAGDLGGQLGTGTGTIGAPGVSVGTEGGVSGGYGPGGVLGGAAATGLSGGLAGGYGYGVGPGQGSVAPSQGSSDSGQQ